MRSHDTQLRNINKCISWFMFRLLYMQSEAFRFERAFEHSPKPSKYRINKVFNDFHVKQMSDSKLARVCGPQHGFMNVRFVCETKYKTPGLRGVKETLNSSPSPP